jgi:hypothetical protein
MGGEVLSLVAGWGLVGVFDRLLAAYVFCRLRVSVRPISLTALGKRRRLRTTFCGLWADDGPG